MRTRLFFTCLRDDRGGALVEFAVSFPLLLLLCMGTSDFGRMFFHAVTISNAAATGAFYGAQNNVNSSQYDLMADRATEDANNLENVTASATRYCECPGDPPTAISCNEASNKNACSDYGYPRAYVRTDVDYTFQTMGPYPGIPYQTQLDRSAYMRVQ